MEASGDDQRRVNEDPPADERPPEDRAESADERRRLYDLDRMILLSDAVIAIAITLLALNFRIPELEDEQLNQLGDKLVDLLPVLSSYVLSFVVIARYWMLHHQLCGRLQKVDRRFIGLNLLWLFLIALVPYPTAVHGEYPEVSTSVILYSISIALVSTSYAAMIVYATRSGLLMPDRERDTWAGWLMVYIPAVFLLSIPIALVIPQWAALTWWSVIIARVVFKRRGRRKLRAQSGAS
jgi:TMEM175 potassium channel family protein